jgi:rhodanese-related sulfurtransferase
MFMHSAIATSPYEAVRTLSPEALLQQLRSDIKLTILDVRDRPETWATGVIPGARVYPQAQLSARLEELASASATPVVVVSQGFRRAHAAVLELQAAGFHEVVLLEGGMNRWLELAYPVEPRGERCSTPPSRRS